MQPEKTTGILSLPQKLINRQLYEMIMKAGGGEGGGGDASAIKELTNKIKSLTNIIGNDTTANTILKRLKDIEGTIGNDTIANTILNRLKYIEDNIVDETTKKAILKNLANIEALIGDDTSGYTLCERLNSIETAIGTETTSGSMLYRIKTLEENEKPTTKTDVKIYIKDKTTHEYLSGVGIQIPSIMANFSETTEAGGIPYYYINGLSVGDYELELHKTGYQNIRSYPISLLNTPQNTFNLEMEQNG